ncbi:MAG: UDP-N-acetylglucosamine 2-epimerase (non-hydrolyzing) [Archaeoglobaceae archaeon]
MIAIILGTRPEIVKMSPVIRQCEKNCVDYFILHTGQHYSYEMDRIFFEELELPKPKYNLNIGSGSHAEQTAKMLVSIEKVLIEEEPSLVLVHGDTNTTLAGALASAKLHIPIGHVEAGLRSFDRRMPEEINRVLVDHISDYLFAPTDNAKLNLLKEGIEESKIFVTGNTIVDAVYQNLEIAMKRSNILERLSLKPKNYFLVTLHRQENVDFKERLEKIIEGLRLIYEEFSTTIILPIHPRTKKMIEKFGLNLDGINTINPVGFMDFLQLEANAKLILTDSGGVQEESCILGVPCVTLRETTERPETIEVGANILAGVEPERILSSVKKMIERKNKWQNPFGDGKAAERILKITLEVLK